MLGEKELRAVKAFEEATSDFVARYGGVPHCPQCGVEAIPNPFPWLVGAHTWSCVKEDFKLGHGDFQSWDSRVPPRSWVATEKHPAYIHEAFRRREVLRT